MINFNGNFVDGNSDVLKIDNRGYKFGDGLFETIKAVGGKILFWEDHYFRLMASMRILRMEIPMNFTMEFLENEIIKTLDKNGLIYVNSRVRLTIDRGDGGYYKPISKVINFSILCEEIIDVPDTNVSNSSYRVDLFKDHYLNPGLLSTLKSNNKLINILGSIYAEENDLENCIILNTEKKVVEALNANIFLVNDNEIKTPPLSDGCLNGIIRKQIIKMLKSHKDYMLVEESISPFEIQKSDEIFLTNSISGITSVTNYRKKTFENRITSELKSLLQEKISDDLKSI